MFNRIIQRAAGDRNTVLGIRPIKPSKSVITTDSPKIALSPNEEIKLPSKSTIQELINVTPIPSEPTAAPAPAPTPAPPPTPMIPRPRPAATASVVIPANPKPVEQNPNRYRFNSEAGKPGRWTISASPNIPALELPSGEPIKNLVPLLKANGVIVKVQDVHFVSPETLKAIQDSANPHYDTVENGTVMGAVMGKSVPIIEIDASTLKAAGEAQDGVTKYAGVSKVDYIYESELVEGIPMGLIDQINYTLNPNIKRPSDTFEIYNITLEANYSIEKLKTDNKQADGTLDQKKLDAFLLGVNQRMYGLTTDFNKIKRLFYEGQVPDTSGVYRITRQANTTATEDTNKPEKSTYIIKEPVKLAGTQETPTQAAATAAATPTGPSPEEIQTQINDAVKAALAAQQVAAGNAQAAATANANAAAERDRKIRDWVAYGFTNAEKAALKQPKRDTNFFGRANVDNVTRGTRTVNVNIQWPYGVTTKARIVDPVNWMNVPTRNRLQDYYGISPYGPFSEALKQKWYTDRNRERMADLLILAEDITEIERETNKFY